MNFKELVRKQDGRGASCSVKCGLYNVDFLWSDSKND